MRRHFAARLKRTTAGFKRRVRARLLVADSLLVNEQARDYHGRWTSGAVNGLIAAGANIAHIEHATMAWVKDKCAAAVSKLPPSVQRIVRGTHYAAKCATAAAFVNFTATQALAERVARERGATPEQARRLRGILSTVDSKTFEVLKVATIAGVHAAHAPAVATALLPIASTSYLAYSTARNPLATWRAAKGLVSDHVEKLAKKLVAGTTAFNASTVDQLVTSLAACGYDDWYIAILHAGMAETGSLADAVPLADELYAKQPTANDSLDQARVAAFESWLDGQFGAHDRDAWQEYLEAGYRKGAGRAFDDARRQARAAGTEDFYAGLRQQFLDDSFAVPASRTAVRRLVGATFDYLDDVDSDVKERMSQALATGLVEGKDLSSIADDLDDAADIGFQRSKCVARTELVRAHAEGQLDSLEELGIYDVGAAVEFSTSGKSTVCEKCASLAGTVLSTADARGVIPVHPNCCCAWIPADPADRVSREDVDEDEDLLDNAEQARDWHGRWTSGSGVDVHEHLEKSAAGRVKYTRIQLDKMKALNPAGPEAGVFKVPKALKAEHIRHLQDILPEGTHVKQIDTSGLLKKQAAVAASSLPPGHVSRSELASMSVLDARDHLMSRAVDMGHVQEHGMTSAQAVRGVTVEGINYMWAKGDIDVSISARDSIHAVASTDIHPTLMGTVTHVVFTDQRNAEDAHWEKEYGMPGFRSLATGGQGKIVVYNSRSIDPPNFAHEAGHNLARKAFGSATPPSSSAYGKAQLEEPPVSHYGGRAPAEDFAEACRIYSMGSARRAGLAKFSPKKFAALQELLDGPGVP